MKKLVFMLFLLFSMLVTATVVNAQTCPYNKGEHSTIDITTQSYKLFKSIEEKIPAENILIPSLSNSMALTMLYCGAVQKTQEEIADNLFYPNSLYSQDKKDVALGDLANTFSSLDQSQDRGLYLASGIFTMKAVNPEFSYAMNNCFKAKVYQTTVNSIVGDINDFISEHTNGKIDNVIQKSSAYDVNTSFLVSASYFKQKWITPFKKAEGFEFNLDETTAFSSESKSVHEVTGMTVDGRFRYQDFGNFHAVAIPYKENFTLIIFAPKQDFSYKNSVSEIALKDINSFITNKELFKRKVIIKMPKFKFEFTRNLNNDYRNVGMNSLFVPGNLDEITPQFRVVNVITKSMIDVDEKGTVATGAVVVHGTKGVSFYEESLLVNINSPFLFAIYDELSKNILFIGKLVDPS